MNVSKIGLSNHPLDIVPIRGGNEEEVRGLLRLLPENTFRFVREFRRGLFLAKEEYCGQIGIYAKKEPVMGERAVSLIVVNEHLFGDPTTLDYNPCLIVPDEATNIVAVPPRRPPLIKDSPFSGVEFSYRDAKFFFGYELSAGAYRAIVDGLKKRED